MNVYCTTNEAFEDTLTTAKTYPVLVLRNGSVCIHDDQGQERWFGLSRFELRPAGAGVDTAQAD